MINTNKQHPCIITLGICLMAVLLPMAINAQTWNESFDSGQTIALSDITSGTNPLTTINGHHIAQWDATDIYCVTIQDLNTFQAHLSCATIDGKDLWLFDENGYGVSMVDGCNFSVTQVTSQFGSVSGLYYLAVTANNSEAQSSSGSIWNPLTVSGERAPDGPGAANPLSSWVDPPSVITTNYTVYLSGAEVCDGAVSNESIQWGNIKSSYR